MPHTWTHVHRARQILKTSSIDSEKEPCTHHVHIIYIFWKRALHTVKRAQNSRKSHYHCQSNVNWALRILEKSLYILKRALHILKRAQHSRRSRYHMRSNVNRALRIHSTKKPYIFEKSPTYFETSPAFSMISLPFPLKMWIELYIFWERALYVLKTAKYILKRAQHSRKSHCRFQLKGNRALRIASWRRALYILKKSPTYFKKNPGF